MGLVYDTLSDGAFQMCDVLSKYWEGFEVLEQTRIVTENNESD